MKIMGIDQSLTGTGIVVLNEGYQIVYNQLIVTKPKDFDLEIKRLVFIKNSIEKICIDHNVDQGFMEGFAYGSKGQAIFQIAGLGYLIRELFHDKNLPLTIITPGELKKYATGKGNCHKDLVLLGVYKKFGVEFDDDNICDAYVLARMGMDKCTQSKK